MMAAATLPEPAAAHHHHGQSYHDPNLALQQYLALQSQHETLLNQLDEMRLAVSSSAASSPTTPSRSSGYPAFAAPAPAARRHNRSSSRRSHRETSLETIVDESTLHMLAAQQQKVFAVSEAIKRALTELLNCDAVRNDKALRMWVQTRLMDTERELRSGRRKRGFVGLD